MEQEARIRQLEVWLVKGCGIHHAFTVNMVVHMKVKQIVNDRLFCV